MKKCELQMKSKYDLIKWNISYESFNPVCFDKLFTKEPISN